jgi:hypothetical protein
MWEPVGGKHVLGEAWECVGVGVWECGWVVVWVCGCVGVWVKEGVHVAM